MEEPCVFCQIIRHELPALILFQDEDFIAILDKRPLFLGHSLLMPVRHIHTFYDLPEDLVKPYFLRAQKLGSAIQKAMHSEGSFIAMNNIISQSVPHFHTHIVPRNHQDGLKGFFWPRQQFTEEQMIAARDKIKKHI